MFVLNFWCVLCYRFLIFVRVHVRLSTGWRCSQEERLLGKRFVSNYHQNIRKSFTLTSSLRFFSLERNTIKILIFVHTLLWNLFVFFILFFVSRNIVCRLYITDGKKSLSLVVKSFSSLYFFNENDSGDSNNDNGVNRLKY